MATYAEVSITGYNANPPSDDGTQDADNEVSWSKHTDKIGDPLKAAIEATQTAITTVVTALTGELNAPSGTRLLFQQDTPPTGWTKEASSTYDNAALRIVTGTPTTGGTTAFTSVFTARTILKANLPDYTLPDTLTVGGSQGVTLPRGGNQNNVVGTNGDVTVAGVGNYSFTVSGSNFSVLGGVTLGGSGTAMDFAVKYADFVIAEKD